MRHPILVGCALIIPMIIQTIGLDPTGAVWTDEASNGSRPDPSGAILSDAEHPTRNRKVESSPAPLRYVEVRPIDQSYYP
jgi:hypothetical protein